MKKTNKILAIILAILIMISIIPITASAATYTGACGDNATWTYDSTTYTLTISGTGDMYDYKSNNRPWESYEDNIKTVVINDGITTIGAYAFYSFGSVESIAIPKSIYAIGKYAFNGCKKLTSITIPDSVTIIEERTFTDCKSLNNIVLPNKVTTINDYAFSSCENLEKITIPKGVKTIGNRVFYCCYSLKEISFPDGLISIGSEVFAGCENLAIVKIPASVTTIGELAFLGCENLTKIMVDSESEYYSTDEYNSVLFNKDKTALIIYLRKNLQTIYNIPDTVITICESAFLGCENLTTLTIGKNVEVIGDNAFDSCFGLTNLIIPDNVKTIGDGAFYNCFNLASVKIGNSVTSIGNNAFSFNDYFHPDEELQLKELTLGNSVTIIGEYAFCNCELLTSVTIPDSVETIGFAAFSYCNRLTDVYYSGTEEDWDNISISNNNSQLLDATIHYNYTPPFTGIKDDQFYKEDVMQKAYQLVEFDGDFYYIGDRHEIVKDKKVYIKEERLNGLTYADGTPIIAGTYEFDENGKMVILDGVVGNNIYKNNVKLKAYQLVEVDGDFYYIGDRHQIVKDKKVYIKEERLNGLTYSDGTPLTAGTYTFDENGKMVILNGLVGDSIYKNNVQLKAYQLVEVDGDFYYIGDRHQIVKDKKVYIKEERLNGLTYQDGTPITAGYYNFDADGKMIIE